MYTENSPIILEKLKSEKCWFPWHLENWDEIVNGIEIIPKAPLRWKTMIEGHIPVLQQKYSCIVHFSRPVDFGNPAWTYDERHFSYWLNVPTEEGE